MRKGELKNESKTQQRESPCHHTRTHTHHRPTQCLANFCWLQTPRHCEVVHAANPELHLIKKLPFLTSLRPKCVKLFFLLTVRVRMGKEPWLHNRTFYFFFSQLLYYSIRHHHHPPSIPLHPSPRPPRVSSTPFRHTCYIRSKNSNPSNINPSSKTLLAAQNTNHLASATSTSIPFTLNTLFA